MSLVEFTQITPPTVGENTSVWVNPDHVYAVRPQGSAVSVIDLVSGTAFVVAHAAEEVVDALTYSEQGPGSDFDLADLFGSIDMESMMAEMGGLEDETLLEESEDGE